MTDTFDATWLELREGPDHRSRARKLLAPLREWWIVRGASSVVDLGCGTGSNLRYLAPELPGPQTWTLVDHDAELLGRIRARSDSSASSAHPEPSLRPVRHDLAAEGPAVVTGADLVTASALLDLVSEPWLDDLVDACTEAGSAALFALSYDGTISWEGPADPLDALVRDAVNAHQRRDKGFGPALGPEAGRVAGDGFAARGYRTTILPSPWELGPDDKALARALVEGWADAASEQRPDRAAAVRSWAERRLVSVDRPDLGVTVGHVDLLAIPPEPEP